MKTCKVCNEDKPDSHFHPNRQWCKPCYNESTRNAKYMKRYGISATQADKMKERGCEVCGDDKKLVIDHNHTTGEVRGVLCHGCNTGIGHLGDNPERLEAAVVYLMRVGHYGP